MKGMPVAAVGTLHWVLASSAWISADNAALAVPGRSSAASHAGPTSIAGALSNPAPSSSRRVTGRL